MPGSPAAPAKFGPVHVLDPFAVTGKPSAAFNPLDALDPDGLDVAEDASTLADALVYDEPGTAGEAHWNEEAKALIAGVILHIVASEPRDRRTLATLRENLTLAPEAFSALLKAMQASTAAGGLVARAANRHLGKSDREAAGAFGRAAPCPFPRLAAHDRRCSAGRISALPISRPGPPPSSSSCRPIVSPPDSRWLRLLVTQSLTDMARAASSSPAPVLYLLDEFAALGYLAPSSALWASWPATTSSSGPSCRTFTSSAPPAAPRRHVPVDGVLQVFGVNDHESARLVSDLLGQEAAVFKTMGQALDSDKSGISYGEHHSGRPLLTPDEVRSLPQNLELLFLAGQRPVAAGKLAYYADPEFRGLFDWKQATIVLGGVKRWVLAMLAACGPCAWLRSPAQEGRF